MSAQNVQLQTQMPRDLGLTHVIERVLSQLLDILQNFEL